MEHILSATGAIIAGIAAMTLYFFGTNWLLDTFLADTVVDREVVKSRAHIREAVRPWLFIAPALILLTLFLIYPVVRTFMLTTYNDAGREYVGFKNVEWAFSDKEFGQSVMNNILWLAVVPAASTVFGMLVAVLADRVRWGNIAKSLIFMPMAISFVGASVIWKFMYDYRPAGQDQIGVVNAIVVALGGKPQAWLTIPIWNNFFLMIILVWIQTGFAMVVLSAALRGVPEETMEAARIDGANEVQAFFRVIIPQVMGTIIVVFTTITITTLKVFDIVQTMTNGQWDTQVLANLMYDWMFRGGGHFGRGSVIASVIMVAVIPIIYLNIRRYHKQEELR